MKPPEKQNHISHSVLLLPSEIALVLGIARGMRAGLDTRLSHKGKETARLAQGNSGQCQAMGHSARAAPLCLVGCSRLVLPSGEAAMQSYCNETPQSMP